MEKTLEGVPTNDCAVERISQKAVLIFVRGQIKRLGEIPFLNGIAVL
jgi:hypothetical protein